jgi:hypothetical protein
MVYRDSFAPLSFPPLDLVRKKLVFIMIFDMNVLL